MKKYMHIVGLVGLMLVAAAIVGLFSGTFKTIDQIFTIIWCAGIGGIGMAMWYKTFVEVEETEIWIRIR